jgi:SAM-dependent methyltransferase
MDAVAPLRKPLQGLRNIVRFNWHFYALAFGLALVVGLVSMRLAAPYSYYGWAGLGLLLAPVLVSLAVSTYVYDYAGLYELDWLPASFAPAPGARLLTISAGFDEVTPLLARSWPADQLLAVDFYDPTRHTEVSIRRARLAYPPVPGTQPVSTRALPLPTRSVSHALAFLAAHEVRDAAERAVFFQEIHRVLRPAGEVIVVEHLRDTANFLAYTIGFFHFHSRRAWLATFAAAGLRVAREVKITPFLTAFILRSHDAPA